MFWFINQVYFQDDVPNLLADDRDMSIMDIGCGPSICNVISASLCSRRIYLAELLEGNRNEIIKFLCNDPDAWNWLPYFEFQVRIDWKFFLLLINCVIIGNIRIWWRSNFYWEEIEKIYHWNFGMQFSWWTSFCSRCLQKKSWCNDLFSSVWCHLHWYQPAWICNE